ncbi:MAG: CCA tRNA nucleotidyltransferase [Candidatus Omnitrophica bacterium]|nr:CCA tRNA nucleotidyltransferase [Candidatus Omnitrophota bacterium]
MDLKANIREIPYINKIKKIACLSGVEVYLIGGFLRDVILRGKPEKLDFDFALKTKIMKFAKDFSKSINGRIVVLDRVLRNVRVVLKKNKQILNYDFSEFRAENLLEDAKKRDFTINTLAAKINNLPKVEIIDYLGARKDLKRKILRAPSDSCITDDPLRIMRAFSLSALFGLGLDKKTKTSIKKHASLLSGVAGERISEELFKIFSVSNSHKTLAFMDKFGVLEKIFPEIKPMRNLGQGKYHHLDVWRHSLETLRCFERLVNKKLATNSRIRSYLDEEVAQKRTRAQLIKFACLFHDVGKPKARRRKKKKTLFHSHEKIGRDMTERISKRLRLSLKEEEFIKHLIYLHLRPGYLADIKRPTQRAIYRYFRDTKDEAVGVLLLSLSDWRATRGPLTNLRRRRKHEKVMFSLINEYFQREEKIPPRKLATGYDIMRKFNIPPSPLVGAILRKIDEFQALGKVATKKQALSLAAKVYLSKQMAEKENKQS